VVWRAGDEAWALGQWATPGKHGWAALLQAIGARLPAPPRAVGFGFAGTLDEDGVVTSWPNRPDLLGFDLVAASRETFGARPHWRDDCASAAWAEHLAAVADAGSGADGGAATGTTLYVGFGTGIGAGAVIGGRLHEGARRQAWGLGHVAVPAALDRPCACGRRGCVQALAGGRALLRRAAELSLGPTAFFGAVPGHPARLALEEAARAGAEAVALLAGLLDPERIVLGGGLVEKAPAFADPLDAELRARGWASERARLGIWAGALGATLPPDEPRPLFRFSGDATPGLEGGPASPDLIARTGAAA
jgi:kanosamine 6-kinase